MALVFSSKEAEDAYNAEHNIKVELEAKDDPDNAAYIPEDEQEERKIEEDIDTTDVEEIKEAVKEKTDDEDEDEIDAEIKKAKKEEAEAAERVKQIAQQELDLEGLSTKEKIDAIHEQRMNLYDSLSQQIGSGLIADMMQTEKFDKMIGDSFSNRSFIHQLNRVDKREQDLLLRVKNAKVSELEVYGEWLESTKPQMSDYIDVPDVKMSSTFKLRNRLDKMEKSKDQAEAETTARTLKQQTKYAEVMSDVKGAVKSSAFMLFVKDLGSKMKGLLTKKEQMQIEDIKEEIEENADEFRDEMAEQDLLEAENALNEMNEAKESLEKAEESLDINGDDISEDVVDETYETDEYENMESDDMESEDDGLDDAIVAGAVAVGAAVIANEISEQNDEDEKLFKDLVEEQEFPDPDPDAFIEQPIEENMEEDYDGSTYSPEEIAEAKSAEQTEAESAEPTETNDGESKYTMNDIRDEYREKIVGANGSDGKFKITAGSLYRMLHITANEQDLEKRSVMVDNLKSMVGANIYERLVSMNDDKNISEDAVIAVAGSKFKHESEFVKECVKSYLIDKQNASDENKLPLFEHNCAEKEGKVIVGFDNAKITNDLIDCLKTLEQNSNIVFEHNINEGVQNKQSAITLLKETMEKQKEKQTAVEIQKEEQVEQPNI